MEYIYDILLNFKDEFYDFYEWNNNDRILHIRKIPIFKVSTDDYKILKNHNVLFDLKFLQSIKNRCELYGQKKRRYLEYAFILTDGNDAFAIKLEKDKIEVSSLLVEEELDTLEHSLKYDLEKIVYDIKDKRKANFFKTRKDSEIEKYLIKEIENLKKEPIDKLKYIYYECFDEFEENREKIISRLYKGLDYEFDSLSKKLYTFFKLVHK